MPPHLLPRPSSVQFFSRPADASGIGTIAVPPPETLQLLRLLCGSCHLHAWPGEMGAVGLCSAPVASSGRDLSGSVATAVGGASNSSSSNTGVRAEVTWEGLSFGRLSSLMELPPRGALRPEHRCRRGFRSRRHAVMMYDPTSMTLHLLRATDAPENENKVSMAWFLCNETQTILTCLIVKGSGVEEDLCTNNGGYHAAAKSSGWLDIVSLKNKNIILSPGPPGLTSFPQQR